MTYIEQDTICAIATASGPGAISLIRVSGQDAFKIVQAVFKGKNLSEQKPYTIHFGSIVEDQQVVDEVLVSVFKNPKSYTGEDLLEISCHGSSFIQQKIIHLLLKQGARIANRGEFTLRAFLNGKLNLSQAEAVADLIASDNEAQHSIAMQQMRGGFQSDLSQLREKLINFAAFIELELDFSEEDVEFVDRTQLLQLLKEIKQKLLRLSDSFFHGNAIKQGISTVIAGRPNAGKSTLLNALLNEERAIVSEIAGTTRDTIEETLTLSGITYRFIDTAGIRKDTQDSIEKIGIQKTKDSIDKAKVLLYVFDVNTTTPAQVQQDIADYAQTDVKLLLIGNKKDLLSEAAILNIQETLQILLPKAKFLAVSAKQKEAIETIKTALSSFFTQGDSQADQSIVSNIRHFDALSKALVCIGKVEAGIAQNISSDFLAMDIRQSLYHIGEITGEVDVDIDILGTIFSKFCIGK